MSGSHQGPDAGRRRARLVIGLAVLAAVLVVLVVWFVLYNTAG